MDVDDRQQIQRWLDEQVRIRRDAEYSDEAQAFAHVAIRALCDLDDDEAYEACQVGTDAKGAPNALWLDESGPRAVLLVTVFAPKGKAVADLSAVASLNSAISRFASDPQSDHGSAGAVERQIKELRNRDTSVPIEAMLVFAGTIESEASSELDQVAAAYEDQEITVRGLGLEELLDRIAEALSREAPEMSDPVTLTLLDHFVPDADPPAIVANLDALELAKLEQRYGFRIFQSNVRYLLKGRQRINEGIEETLKDAEDRPNFWYYNNGISVMCDEFDLIFEGEQKKVVIKNFQIVNGCQTTATLARVIEVLQQVGKPVPILARIIASENEELRDKIPLFNNRQNAVKNRDLQSNDRIQTQLQAKFANLSPPWFYERKRGEWDARGGAKLAQRYGSRRIENDVAAQAYYAMFHDAGIARARKRFLFTRKQDGGLYDFIFNRDTKAEPLLLAFRAGKYVKKKADAYRREIRGVKRGSGPAAEQKKLDLEWFKFGEQFVLGAIGWHILRHTDGSVNHSALDRLATSDFDTFIEAVYPIAFRDLTLFFRRVTLDTPVDSKGERERVDFANYVKGNWSEAERQLEAEWKVVRRDEPDPLASFFE
jgi:AIPR protein